MAELISFQTIKDNSRGNLTVMEKVIPYEIKRVFYIYDIPPNTVRGGHRHHKTKRALIAVSGSLKVYVNNGKEEKTYELNHPHECLILQPEDWHKMYDFAPHSVLLVLASEYFYEPDYIDESY